MDIFEVENWKSPFQFSMSMQNAAPISCNKKDMLIRSPSTSSTISSPSYTHHNPNEYNGFYAIHVSKIMIKFNVVAAHMVLVNKTVRQVISHWQCRICGLNMTVIRSYMMYFWFWWHLTIKAGNLAPATLEIWHQQLIHEFLSQTFSSVFTSS